MSLNVSLNMAEYSVKLPEVIQPSSVTNIQNLQSLRLNDSVQINNKCMTKAELLYNESIRESYAVINSYKNCKNEITRWLRFQFDQEQKNRICDNLNAHNSQLDTQPFASSMVVNNEFVETNYCYNHKQNEMLNNSQYCDHIRTVRKLDKLQYNINKSTNQKFVAHNTQHFQLQKDYIHVNIPFNHFQKINGNNSLLKLIKQYKFQYNQLNINKMQQPSLPNYNLQIINIERFDQHYNLNNTHVYFVHSVKQKGFAINNYLNKQLQQSYLFPQNYKLLQLLVENVQSTEFNQYNSQLELKEGNEQNNIIYQIMNYSDIQMLLNALIVLIFNNCDQQEFYIYINQEFNNELVQILDQLRQNSDIISDQSSMNLIKQLQVVIGDKNVNICIPVHKQLQMYQYFYQQEEVIVEQSCLVLNEYQQNNLTNVYQSQKIDGLTAQYFQTRGNM